MPVLIALSIGLQVCAAAADLTGKWPSYRAYGACSVAYGLAGIEAFRERYPLFVCVYAALCAYFGWQWWKGGGGDDAKRRLRRLRQQFTPTRRTAPTAA